MNWLRRLVRKQQLEVELEKELQFHLQEHVADLLARGYPRDEAERQARLALGGPEQVKEECRTARGTRWLEDAIQDAHYAARNFRKRPGFTAIALTTLALGVGGVSLMFTLVYGVLLKALPYSDTQTLLTVHGYTPTWNVKFYGQQNLAYPDFLDLQKQSRSVTLAGWVYEGGTVSAPGDPQYLDKFEISSNLFDLLGVRLLHGRGFSRQEDAKNAAAVAILGYSFWHSTFGGNANVIGTTIICNDRPYTVIGIAPADFRLGGNEGDLYTPLGQATEAYLTRRDTHPVNVVARLRSGVTLSQAQAELTLVANRLSSEYPDTNKGRTFTASRLQINVGDARATLWLLLGAVSLVLLVACANVGGLLLARSLSLTRELATRAALGAGRGRLIRQSLTESAVLALCGGAFGIAVAAIGVAPLLRMWPDSLPRAEEVTLDWHVVLCALAVSIVTGVLFGLIPALRISVEHLEERLRTGGRALVGTSRRLHSAFVVCQIAVASVLLVSAGALGSTLLRLSSLTPGIDVHNVLVSRMALSRATLNNSGAIRAAWKEILEDARTVPGVQSVALVDTVPMRQGSNELGYWTSADVPPGNKLPFALATSVTPNYLNVMRIPLLKGRFFNDRDRIGTEMVIVIDDVLAQHAFGKTDPIGKHLWIPDMTRGPVTVVGVIGHVRHWGLAADDQAPLRDQVYYPFAQVPDTLLRRWSELMSIAVRTNVNPLSVLTPLRRKLKGVTSDQVLYMPRTMEQLVKDSLAKQRFLMLLFGVFAGFALLLACIGVYGVLAYLTGERVPEFGLRMALGASGRAIEWLVFKHSLVMICVGVAIGISGGVLSARALTAAVPGMQPVSAATFATTLTVLIVAALLASFVPARRASAIDPMNALRQD
jgi:predicted permease